jgi:adenylylsulfate kinase-like enzyme
MIIVFYGQPSSGKTTLAKLLQERIFLLNQPTPVIVDGDEIREIFNNNDYSREGRIKNLNTISDIATFLENKYNLVIISAVYPIKEARDYLNSICKNVFWVHLSYTNIREKDNFHVEDFDLPDNQGKRNLSINTSNFSPDDCIDRLLGFLSF